MRRLIIVLMLTVSCQVHALGDSERIQGVAEFLIDRANDNYLYIFEKKIRDNADFACYFPNTRENLEVGGLKELLYSRGVWQSSIEKDLEQLAVRSLASHIEQTMSLSQKSVDIASKYLQAIQLMEVEYRGQRYPMHVVDPSYPAELIDLINGFYSDINVILASLSEFSRYRDICTSPRVDYAAFRKRIAPLVNLADGMSQWRDYVERNARHLHLKENGKPEEVCDQLKVAKQACTSRGLPGQLVTAISEAAESLPERGEIESLLVELDELREVIRRTRSVNANVIEALKLLKKKTGFSDARFKRLSRHITFFAQISDSESPTEVKQILQAYTLPAVSFYLKREPVNHWMISAYLGLSYAEVGNDGANKEASDFGIFAPIGLEYSRGLGNGDSISLMVSPFDFGYPVNLKLNGIEEDVELDEIAAPSITLGYGFRDYPLILGLGYQKGRKFDNESETEERWLLFFSFDMPLFLLH